MSMLFHGEGVWSVSHLVDIPVSLSSRFNCAFRLEKLKWKFVALMWFYLTAAPLLVQLRVC